ncbi:hypothetical protein EV667_2942 [Ancylobacter aquaticus]|uniref:Uncharacterized protein n=1 Tax=Ancylobacter aquaticus TaxID=100 RepID=A0A4R1I176_ANCAQ|nr:hypothetical protein [Ancylobacter aquaticus]TCK28927.1 hypothetical protein EV667_2942 [Ancylobacter aquaticus]
MFDRLRRLPGRRLGSGILGSRFLPTVAILVAALGLGACQTNGTGKPVAAVSASSGSRTIAFESIDGAPEPVFDRLVADLSSEAKARQIPIVSRDSPAAYRVRGYLAASVTNGKGEVDWVWDVFDADSDRVLRVAGREKLGPGKDVWGKLDDATVQRIAAQSLDEISARLSGGAPSSSASPAASPELDPADAPPVVPGDGPAIAEAAPDDIPADTVAAASDADEPSRALTFAAHP